MVINPCFSIVLCYLVLRYVGPKVFDNTEGKKHLIPCRFGFFQKIPAGWVFSQKSERIMGIPVITSLSLPLILATYRPSLFENNNP